VKLSAIGIIIALAVVTAPVAAGEDPPHPGSELVMPQVMRSEYDKIAADLGQIALHRGPLAHAAIRVLWLMKAHFAKESEFVFPPLGLLPALAEGRASPEDMRAALAMVERVKAEQERLFEEHAQITSALIDLTQKAAAANDERVGALAQAVARRYADEVEVLVPAVLLLGDYIRMKLAVGM
jgi:pyruvate-formate lyase